MKKSFLTLLIVFIALSCAPKEPSLEETAPKATAQGAAQTSIEPGKGVLIEQAIEVKATVVAVDRADRTITVKDAEGKVHDVELTDDVKNFDQIDPGDQIVMDVYSALSLQLAKPGEEFEDKTTNAIAVAEPGEKPKIVNVDMVQALCEITAINRDTREITVTGPRGNSLVLTVPPDIEEFDQRKVGEKVNATYVEAFAIAVREI